MLTIKEQAEIYRLGLLIDYFKTEDVVNWADTIILSQDCPDNEIIELSLFGKKGINESLALLNNINGTIDDRKPIKTVLGLLYKSLNNKRFTIKEITTKLYILSLNISEINISVNIINKLNFIDDYFHFYTEERIVFLAGELLKEFEPFAEELFHPCH